MKNQSINQSIERYSTSCSATVTIKQSINRLSVLTIVDNPINQSINRSDPSVMRSIVVFSRLLKPQISQENKLDRTVFIIRDSTVTMTIAVVEIILRVQITVRRSTFLPLKSRTVQNFLLRRGSSSYLVGAIGPVVSAWTGIRNSAELQRKNRTPVNNTVLRPFFRHHDDHFWTLIQYSRHFHP